MSVNSSSSSNASLPPLSPSSSNVISFLSNCLSSTPGAISATLFIIISVLVLLPLYTFVLYLGHRRWQKQRRSSTISHSDLLTYHMVFIELISVSGSIVLCCGVHADLPQLMILGIYLFTINIFGQMFFHLLTCVERYLAVVHPITYLSLKKAKWIRVRHITVGCVWLLCFAVTGLMSVGDEVSFFTLRICVTALVLIVISSVSISILRVLIRPGPGEEGGGRQRVDQSKLRAFHTIMVILILLFYRLGGGILACALYLSQQLGETERCSVALLTFWFSLPSSLVLPLLFLQRTGKLPCCKNSK